MNNNVKCYIMLALTSMCWGCGSSAEDPSASPADSTSSSTTSSLSTTHYAEATSLASSIAVGDLGRALTPAGDLKIAQAKTLDVIYKNGPIDYVFADESITSEDGSVIVNGTSSLSKSDPITGHAISADLDLELKDFSKNVAIDKGSYKTTLNGKLKISVTGNLRTSMSDGAVTQTTDITITGSGSNLNVIGDVSGTIINLNMTRHEKVTSADSNEQRITTCSGTATVKTATSTTTCTFQEDCLSCR